MCHIFRSEVVLTRNINVTFRQLKMEFIGKIPVVFKGY